MAPFHIAPLGDAVHPALLEKINLKTKPIGSLGRLEEVALQIGLIQGTLTPQLLHPHVLVFAGDHGIAHEGVSAYPQEVTWQMVMNFLNGGAAINVFCKQHGIALKVIDAGVNHEFPKETAHQGLIHKKIGRGTQSFVQGAAMTLEQAQQALDAGAGIVRDITNTGCNVIGFGEMGIANTSSAAVLTSVLCHLPIEQCTGRGTGLDTTAYQRKLDILTRALANNGIPETPLAVLATYGGFEIAQMAGAILQSAELKMTVMIDGFIASAACLVAYAMEPAIKEYCIFCHQSHEQGHAGLLAFMKVSPLLNLGMRLGEGTGVAVAYPIIRSSVDFLNEMASFESAGVSEKSV